MRYIVTAVLAVFLALAPSWAFPHNRDRTSGTVEVQVVSEQGGTLLAIPHAERRRDGIKVIKQYLEARKGEHYGIIIRNRTPERVGVVIAVDGRNIISGKRSDLAYSEEMYLVNAYDEGRFDGWRTDGDTVHRFYFTEPDDSYSVRTFGDTSAMGVIAVAVYREKERTLPPAAMQREDRSPAPSASDGARRSESLATEKKSAGTGFGEAQYSPVIQVAFEPERTPFQRTLIKYEWREVLCRKGLLRCGQEPANRLWDDSWYAPFPPRYADR